MACFVQAHDAEAGEYRGIPGLFAYSNADGALARTNCGQAAAATFLTYYGRFVSDPDQARQVMGRLEHDHPPDNLLGYFGTSRRCVTRICRAYSVPVHAFHEEEALRA